MKWEITSRYRWIQRKTHISRRRQAAGNQLDIEGTHAQMLRDESREKLQQSEEEADDLWVADWMLAT